MKTFTCNFGGNYFINKLNKLKFLKMFIGKY